MSKLREEALFVLNVLVFPFLITVGIMILLVGVNLLPAVSLAGIILIPLAYLLLGRRALRQPRSIAIQVPSLPLDYSSRFSGALHVALLNTWTGKGASFDARTVDISTLRLEPGGAKALAGTDEYDVNGDGNMELILHFPLDKAAIPPDTHEICISGATVDGEPVRGCTYVPSLSAA